MSKLSLIEQQSKKSQTCSSSSSSSSLSTSTVASRIASTSITTSSKRRSTTSRQQHHHHQHQHQQHQELRQQQQQQQHQQHQLISKTTSSSSASQAEQKHSVEAEVESAKSHTMLSSQSNHEQQQQQQQLSAAVHHEATDSRFSSSSSSSVADEQNSSSTAARLSSVRPVSALELRLKDKFRGDLFEEADDDLARGNSGGRKTFQHVEAEESRIRRREESTCISTRKRTSCLLDHGAAAISSQSTVSHQAAASAAAAISTATSMQTTTSGRDGHTSSSPYMTTSRSSSSTMAAADFRNSASLLLSNSHQNSRPLEAASRMSSQRSLLAANQNSGLFLTKEADISSPDARSIYREMDSDFALLENAMMRSVATLRTTRLLKPAALMHRRALSPLAAPPAHGQWLAIAPGPSSPTNSHGSSNSSSTTLDQQPAAAASTMEPSKFSNSLGELSARLNETGPDSRPFSAKGSSERIRELLNRVQEKGPKETGPLAGAGAESGQLLAGQSNCSPLPLVAPPQLDLTAKELMRDEQSNRKAIMSESIERIDQRMGDLCVKLQQSKDSKEAIDLLKIIIQMIEKAWSVPVCGDDLGFKLCNSLREAGGLDFVLGYIQDTVESLMRTDCLVFSPGPGSEPDSLVPDSSSRGPLSADQTSGGGGGGSSSSANGKGLKLDLRKVNQQQQRESVEPKSQAKQQQSQAASAPIRDNDSDIITSDLGLDSTSVESLSYVLPAADEGAKQQQQQEQGPNELEEGSQRTQPQQANNDTIGEESQQKEAPEKKGSDTEDDADDTGDALANDDGAAEPQPEPDEPASSDSQQQQQQQQPDIEEPAFLCARLLSQCLTSENRDYIVGNALDSVIRLACSFSTIKSSRIHRLLSCGSNSRSIGPPAATGEADKNYPRPATSTTAAAVAATATTTSAATSTAVRPSSEATAEQAPSKDGSRCEHSDVHAIIGTEILQHLFKHSEETCHRMISLGGLQAILYGCRSSNVEVLRHCASALANLALYGGPEGQQRMIEQKAHVWLFPLAFNEDDNVQYYACLAIVVLVANKEIEADVLKSSSLDLVEPFVLSHEPQRFAESTTAHIHGQSASWLRKLIPLLESKRQEARNLACFHFAMEAHIKREQAQTGLFREIGAVEPLRKVGSSPQAIAARFACQALRLIGEKEPHKLSQQVPLWTSEDVVEWVSQIGFERFRPAFVESRVDGDLLLQLDEDMLRTDIGIENGIIRRRFLRELTNLKRISDYSSIDKTGLCSILLGASSSQQSEFVQYVYPLLQLGVTRDTIHLFDCEQLLRECKVVNMIHQVKLAQAIKDIQERRALEVASQECSSQNGADQKTLDVFVSYRRSTGSQLASLLKVHLQLRGFTVFIDVERLEAGKFDNNLLDSIKAAKNFIIVLSPSALDRCLDDHGCKDWVHKEIVAALASNCNIIPIIDNFHWPDPEQLPEDMRSIIYFNGVRWIHDYQDACIDKVERFIRGELNNQAGGGGGGQFSAGSQLGSLTAGQSSLQRLSGGQGAANGGVGSMQGLNGAAYSMSSPSVVATPSSGQYQFSRPPPFDGYHHPLSYISHQLQQHSQSSQAAPAATGRLRGN